MNKLILTGILGLSLCFFTACEKDPDPSVNTNNNNNTTSNTPTYWKLVDVGKINASNRNQKNVAEWTDFNNDGLLDFIYISSNPDNLKSIGRVEVKYNTGTDDILGNPTLVLDAADIDMTQIQPLADNTDNKNILSFSLNDLDNDGDLDITFGAKCGLGAGWNTYYEAVMYALNDNGQFLNAQMVQGGNSRKLVDTSDNKIHRPFGKSIDVNKDGKRDFLLFSSTHGVTYLNNGKLSEMTDYRGIGYASGQAPASGLIRYPDSDYPPVNSLITHLWEINGQPAIVTHCSLFPFDATTRNSMNLTYSNSCKIFHSGYPIDGIYQGALYPENGKNHLLFSGRDDNNNVFPTGEFKKYVYLLTDFTSGTAPYRIGYQTYPNFHPIEIGKNISGVAILDVNADGKKDLVVTEADDDYNEVKVNAYNINIDSTKIDFMKTLYVFEFGYSLDREIDLLMTVKDFNGDGKEDIYFEFPRKILLND